MTNTDRTQSPLFSHDNKIFGYPAFLTKISELATRALCQVRFTREDRDIQIVFSLPAEGAQARDFEI